MKKKIAGALAAIIAVCSLKCVSYGASSVSFIARVNGETSAQVDIDGEAVVTMTIEAADSYTFYSMQDYIKFDTDYFRLDENSISVKQVVSLGQNVDLFSYAPISTSGVYDRVFVNRASLTGVDFEAEEVVITFTLKPLKEGQTEITHYRTEMLDENNKRYTVKEVNASVTIGDYEETTEETTAAPSGDDDETTTEAASETTTEAATETTTAASSSGSSSGGGGGGGSSSSTASHTISIVVGDETTTVTVRNGSALEQPEDPEVSGYSFEGWYTDMAYVTEYDFSTLVTGGFTLYAKLVKTGSDDETAADREETGETEAEAEEAYYTDVAVNDWYYDAVEYVRNKGLMIGISEDEFAPNLPLTRGMFVTVLYRIEGTPEVSEEASFKDVSESDWYYEAVKWGDKYDIIFGYSAEEFAPNDRITREQMAAIIYRYAAFKGINTDTEGDPDYTDSGSISNYAVPGVKWVSDKGFMQGDPDGAFRPTDNASRAETAQVIMNVVENLAKV